jgi:ketosteroid isomerase-like protein
MMKKTVLIALVSLFSCTSTTAPKEATMQPKNPEISAAIQAFISAGDARDSQQMEGILDPNFRVIFSSNSQVSALDRATYLSLLQAGKIGGDTRQLELTHTQSEGVFARASANITSPKAHFASEYTLIQRDGQWKLLQDATVFTPKQ